MSGGNQLVGRETAWMWLVLLLKKPRKLLYLLHHWEAQETNPHQNLDLLAPGAVRNKFLSEDFVTSPPIDQDTGWPEQSSLSSSREVMNTRWTLPVPVSFSHGEGREEEHGCLIADHLRCDMSSCKATAIVLPRVLWDSLKHLKASECSVSPHGSSHRSVVPATSTISRPLYLHCLPHLHTHLHDLGSDLFHLHLGGDFSGWVQWH